MASATKRGIGRGLSAILPEVSAGEAGELRELPVGLIKPNPNQPRTHFDQDALDALAASIEARGVIQPLLVRPLHDGSYELVAGERRWRASQQAGLEKVPAVVRSAEQAERLEVALIENMVREDLNPVEEARACAALVDELGLSKEKLAKRVGRSRPAISNLIRILTLPDEVLELLEDRRLSEGHGRALLGLDDHDARRRYARRAVDEGWSVRETEERVKLAGQPKSGRTGKKVSSEEAAALLEVADRFEASLGQEVKVRSRGAEIAVELRFQDLQEAAAFAKRFGRSKG